MSNTNLIESLPPDPTSPSYAGRSKGDEGGLVRIKTPPSLPLRYVPRSFSEVGSGEEPVEIKLSWYKHAHTVKSARAIFLDRDGTINVDHGFVYRVEDFQFAPQAPEGMRLLQDGGYKLIVITNQSGIGHGKYTEDDMHVLHQHMQEQLDGFGVKLDGIAFCPHRRDAACPCRKPGIGMLEQVSDVIVDVDMAQSWMVGDKEADVLFGQTAGMQTALLPSKYWQRDTLVVEPTVFAPSLYAFAKKLTSNTN